MPLFINHTNHPSDRWSDAQYDAAAAYGDIVDWPCPRIPPEADGAEVAALADEAASKILAAHPAAVLCQGESTYQYALVRALRAASVTVLAASSDRVVTETQEADGSTKKISRFDFVRFRAYC